MLYIGGLAVALVLVFALVPNLGSTGLPLLFLLACPLMMIFMMGGNHGGMHAGMHDHGGSSQGDQSHANHNHSNQPALPPPTEFHSREEEVAWLKIQLSDLKLKQDNLTAEINRLDTPAVLEAEAVAKPADERFKNSR
ncbi:MAG: hypothetical protein BGO39_21125 [Chloroflexi bacterium 54-19]|nr:MAG: hypothetical protein BGO39_21125 [Chloroflexi bacterium 54-19]